MNADERDKVVKKKDMYIDIGASSKAEVESAGVKPGDPVYPRADFIPLAGGKTYLSKAFDDRVGVALSISVLRELQGKRPPNSVYAVATTMEEVGPRGATTSVRLVDPDVALVLESDIAGDVPGIQPEESSVKLGGGPTIVIFDARMIPNLKLRDLAYQVAQELEIPTQVSYLEGGATDGSVIHLHGTGVPTLVIGVAARHIHSHSAILHRDDYERAVRLVTGIVMRLDKDTVASLTA